MKFNKYLFILIAGFLSSCTKGFLDVNNTQQLYRESYVKDLTTMHEYLRGTYYHICLNVEGGEVNSTYVELADNLRPVSATSSPNTAANYNWVQEANAFSAAGLNPVWRQSYMTIRMCNFIIDNVDKYRDENPALADNIRGQALAIRAFIYFKLINTYAQPYTFTVDASHPGVPHITTSDITQPYTRNSVREIYAAMIADLTGAIQLLPAATTDIRYMSRNGAKALLARVYLFKEDYANAKALAEEVLNQVPLMTIAAGYPNDVFKFKAATNTETIFQIIPSTSSFGRWVKRSPVKLSATSDIADMLQENSNDIRKNWIKDTIISATTFRLVKKTPDNVSPEFPLITPGDVAYYPPVLRSSEMFLTAAEAAAKTNDETLARKYLNDIRKRANPSIADVTASSTALLDSIYKERRKELSFEGLRLFDLQRWKKGISRTDVLAGSPGHLPYPSNQAIGPIPADEVQLSGIPQNSGY